MNMKVTYVICWFLGGIYFYFATMFVGGARKHTLWKGGGGLGGAEVELTHYKNTTN